jgi:hypothetical protein
LPMLALLQLLFQACDFFAGLRDAPGHADFIDEEDGPDDHPRRQQEFEVFH